MNDQVINVLTRAQSKRAEEFAKRNNPTPVLNKPADNFTDQPRVVELIRKPYDTMEMILTKGEEMKKMRENGRKLKEEECFILDSESNILHINLDFRAQFSRAEFVTKLSNFCEKNNIELICVIKQNDNEKFIKEICNEIKSRSTWTSLRVGILRGIKRKVDKDEKTMVLNDFHLLPTSGHAGVR